jgi:hypothetical protein
MVGSTGLNLYSPAELGPVQLARLGAARLGHLDDVVAAALLVPHRARLQVLRFHHGHRDRRVAAAARV